MQLATAIGLRRRLASLLLATALAPVMASPSAAQTKGPDWTAKLEPRTRTIQMCNFAGLNTFARDKKLTPKPDRVRINASSEPKIDASLVSGSGGAVRSGQRWYTFSFKCSLTANGTKTAGFSYEIGKEIPKALWEKYGLWE